MRIEVRGRNVEVTDELREAVDQPLQARRQAGLRAGDARGRAARGAEPADRGPDGRRGDPAPEGRDPPRRGGLAGHAALDPRARRGHPPPGEEAPREAARPAPPQPPDGLAGCAAAAAALTPEAAPGQSRVCYADLVARGILDRALRMGEGKQFKEYESRVESINADRAGDGAARRRRARRARPTSCASAPARAASRSTTCCPRPSRSPARRPAARSASATTTSS